MRPTAHTKKNVPPKYPLPTSPTLFESHYSFVQNKLSFTIHPKLKKHVDKQSKSSLSKDH